MEALTQLIAARRAGTGVEDGPLSPRVTDLRVRWEGLPDWWREGGNLLLFGEGSHMPEFKVDAVRGPPRRSVVAIGRDSRFLCMTLGQEGALVAIGDKTIAPLGALSCYGSSTVLVGEGTTFTSWAMLDCRNGGTIVTGPDGMWAHNVSLMTDDTRAIRDAATGRRLNTFGGRIVIDRHVWLCERTRVLDGARIGPDSIVGLGALVKRCVIPPNSIAVGVPARVVRSGVTWSRKDAP
ncbi:hypothetical protein [Caulobacter sp. S45]|uniref:acyltransferase n=1 Tax=Caulobacter sp. S45 TaxID=1641861 RepID=UPI0015777703|nr:hypothetical protein [Caulobacter sp. S45]